MRAMKRITLALAICALALPSANAAKKRAKNAYDTEIAAFKISTGTPRNITELIAHFQEIDKNLQSLSARFEQSLTMSDAGISQHVEGSFQYLKPDHIHLEHSKPERQTIVSDGNTIWIYRVDQNQVIKSSLADWKKSDPVINNLLDVGNYS